MASQDLLFPLLPKPGPIVTPGVEMLHVDKIAKQQRINTKLHRKPTTDKFDQLQRRLGREPQPPKSDSEHQIDLFV